MTTTLPDLEHDQHVDITVKIISRQPVSKDARAYLFDVQDKDGNHIPLLVWDKHSELADDLIQGKWARLNDFIVKSWPRHETELQTISTSTVDSVRRSPTRLLHISDTHLGYQLRPESGGKIMPWDEEINCQLRFWNAVSAALENNVDAVIHTGDIFDHAVTDTDLNLVEAGITKLHSEDIPFFYVLGNHEPAEGKARLKELADAELAYPLEDATEGHRVNDVTIYGLDNRPSTWWRSPDVRFSPSSTRYSIVCLHQTVSPPYYKSNPDCDLSLILDTVASNISPDLILLGDLHGPFNEPEARVPVYYAGPTARISRQYRNKEPQANLFEFDEIPSYQPLFL
jgi:DNA repair exonuclease SbcCD nuclease subunit